MSCHAGGRKEAATYDDGDAEDAEIAADARMQAARFAGEQQSDDEDTASPEQTPSAPKSVSTPSNPTNPDQQAAGSDDEDGPGSTRRRLSWDDDHLGAGEADVLQGIVVLPVSSPKILMLQQVEMAAAATPVRVLRGEGVCCCSAVGMSALALSWWSSGNCFVELDVMCCKHDLARRVGTPPA